MVGPRQVFVSLQAARGVAAMMVVVAHVCAFTGNQGLWNHPELTHSMLGMVLGVELFFVLSGIVILSAHWEDIGQPSRIPSYLWKRFRRVYPIYWLILLLTVLHRYLVPEAGLEYQRQPLVILSSFLLVHINSVLTNVSVAWTLFHEILFYAVFALFMLSRKAGWVIFAVWLAASSLFFSAPSESYWGFIFSPLHILFGFGMVVTWLLKKDRTPLPFPALIIGLALFITAIILLPRFSTALPSAVSWINLLAGVGASLLLMGLSELERRDYFTVPRWLSFIGDASYSLYLVHFMVVSTLAHFFFHIDQRLHLPIAFWIVALFSLALLSGCLTYLWVEKPILKLLGKSARPVAHT